MMFLSYTSDKMNDYNQIKHYIPNPKPTTMLKHYGEQDVDAQEWRIVLIAIIFNKSIQKAEEEE